LTIALKVTIIIAIIGAIATIISAVIGTDRFLEWLIPDFIDLEMNSYISSVGNTEDTYFVTAGENQKYAVGDHLVVYDANTRNVEFPIGLLRVIAENPKTLSTQAILVHPNHEIRRNLRVDDQVDKLSTSELLPSNKSAIGYFLGEEEKSIRIHPDLVLVENTVVQGLDPQIIDEAISDWLPFDPPIQMRVKQSGTQNKVARVELITDKWPQIGTLI
jgi:hypothetical protein